MYMSPEQTRKRSKHEDAGFFFLRVVWFGFESYKDIFTLYVFGSQVADELVAELTTPEMLAVAAGRKTYDEKV